MKEKIINFRFVFYPFLAFFFGITMARKLYAGNLETILICLGVFTLLTIYLIIRKRYLPLALLFAFFFIGNGCFYIGMASQKVRDYTSPVSVVGRVTDNIVEYDYYSQFILEDVKIEGKSGGNVRLKVYNIEEDISVGDFIAFEGQLDSSSLFTLGSFNSSNYRNGIKYDAKINFDDAVITDGYLKVDETIRQAVKARLYENMSYRNAGISYAVLFGDKNELDENVKSAYQASGIIHTLTVSGLHVSFLVSLVYGFLKLCRTNKYLRFVLTTIFIFFYAYLCGFAPSVMRAGIMSIVLMLARLLERRYDSLNSLGLAGFLICLFSPLTALDIGFQMSFFCVAGIILLSSPITRLLAKILPQKIARLMALSIAASIGIFPILKTFAPEISIISVFANLIVVPIFGILYPFLFVVAMLSTFLPFLGKLLVLADYVFVAINAVANFFGSSELTFKTSPFKAAIMTIYFVIVFALGRFVMAKSLTKFVFFSCLIFAGTVAFGLYKIPAKAQNVVTYIGNYGQSSVVFVNNKRETLVVGYTYLLSRYTKNFDFDKIDGFIALDKLDDQDFEKLSSLNVQTFIGAGKNAENENFAILDYNRLYSFGEYSIRFVSTGQSELGVNITMGGENIFVASSDEVNYNSVVITNLAPSLVFADGGNFGLAERTIVSEKYISGSDYNLSQHGNMSFKFNGLSWNKRGID